MFGQLLLTFGDFLQVTLQNYYGLKVRLKLGILLRQVSLTLRTVAKIVLQHGLGSAAAVSAQGVSCCVYELKNNRDSV